MKRILVTRPRAQADGFTNGLRAAGFEPISFPVIEIQKIENNIVLERALSRLECYDWVVFTSTNAVDAVWEQMNRLGVERLPESVRVAAIGSKTARVLTAHGIPPAFIPAEYVAEAILPGLGDLTGRWVLLPRAELARNALPDAIVAAGGIAHEIIVYRTLPAQVDQDGWAALNAGVDVITFTSASTVHNFVQIVHQNGIDPLHLPAAPAIACIGPITQQAALEEGFSDAIAAEEYTAEGLIQAIRKMVKK